MMLVKRYNKADYYKLALSADVALRNMGMFTALKYTYT